MLTYADVCSRVLACAGVCFEETCLSFEQATPLAAFEVKSCTEPAVETEIFKYVIIIKINKNVLFFLGSRRAPSRQ
jgi:hypothetical protein